METERKIKEEEQREMRKHHKKAKKKKTVHQKPGAKGITTNFHNTATTTTTTTKVGKTMDDIPFLNEDPYPLQDFVTEYDKTVAYRRNAGLRRKHLHKLTEKTLNDDDSDNDNRLNSEFPSKKYQLHQHQNLDYTNIDSNFVNRNSEHHPLLMQRPDVGLTPSDKRHFTSSDSILTSSEREHLTSSDSVVTSSDKRHLNIRPSYYDTDRAEENDDEMGDDNDDDDRYESTSNVTPMNVVPSPILNEKDALSAGKTDVTALGKDSRKGEVAENNDSAKPKIKTDIDTMIDKAFGEVLDF